MVSGLQPAGASGTSRSHGSCAQWSIFQNSPAIPEADGLPGMAEHRRADVLRVNQATSTISADSDVQTLDTEPYNARVLRAGEDDRADRHADPGLERDARLHRTARSTSGEPLWGSTTTSRPSCPTATRPSPTSWRSTPQMSAASSVEVATAPSERLRSRDTAVPAADDPSGMDGRCCWSYRSGGHPAALMSRRSHGFGLSFFNSSLLIPRPPAWVGLDNYIDALGTSALWAVAGQTLLWVVACIGLRGRARGPRRAPAAWVTVRPADPGGRASWARCSWSPSSRRPRSPCSCGSTCTPSGPDQRGAHTARGGAARRLPW